MTHKFDLFLVLIHQRTKNKDKSKMSAVDKSITCECHKIDWSGGPGNYKYVDTGEPIPTDKCNGFCCQEKVNEGIMNAINYMKVCKYIPGEEGSLFPKKAYLMLLSEYVPPDDLTLEPARESPP